ncbi:alpha/beta hydrolase [Verrucomicrobiaceae bacterium N1E253]|uniref:Alpha/beta hydrolase n=1 Tax=Oceaniferula marina TaxID=2748318 RepID=A0A851GJH9_9BACT|nr:alpha/beta hydrolase [Oceaniferula marina]NWK57329.1 alpha/beta hydrolase [Oceaniferula marina]
MMKKRDFCNLKLAVILYACWVAMPLHAVERYNWTLGYKPDKSIVFSKPDQGKPLKLDIFLPDGHSKTDKRACIIFFFGGGWKSGGTSQFYGFSKYLASRGMVAISAQYRTSRSHRASPRQCVEDGKEAIRYVREHAKEFGISPDKVIAAGGSAGGHVAAACAMCPKIDGAPESKVSCEPNGLVLFNPVYDNGPEGYGHERVAAYWKEISPLHNIVNGLPPTIVFFGSKDVHVPVPTIDAFQKRMVDAGNVCETHVFDGQTHGFFHISKGGRRMFEAVLVKTDLFLVQQGCLSGENKVAEWTGEAIKNIEAEQKARRQAKPPQKNQ